MDSDSQGGGQLGKNPRAYKSEKRNRELAQQKKREAKRLLRLGKKEGEPDTEAVVDGIEPAAGEPAPKEPDGQ
jgi:hypothetical protein